eukprot:GHVN01006608.1.p2 GENE.GHVN01006608.1~~GHVN01006608.1.p2  ORF type:complete len:317 (+),score=54.95 GHVN01006608.1:1167-2117(+)
MGRVGQARVVSLATSSPTPLTSFTATPPPVSRQPIPNPPGSSTRFDSPLPFSSIWRNRSHLPFLCHTFESPFISPRSRCLPHRRCPRDISHSPMSPQSPPSSMTQLRAPHLCYRRGTAVTPHSLSSRRNMSLLDGTSNCRLIWREMLIVLKHLDMTTDLQSLQLGSLCITMIKRMRLVLRNLSEEVSEELNELEFDDERLQRLDDVLSLAMVTVLRFEIKANMYKQSDAMRFTDSGVSTEDLDLELAVRVKLMLSNFLNHTKDTRLSSDKRVLVPMVEQYINKQSEKAEEKVDEAAVTRRFKVVTKEFLEKQRKTG